MKINTDDHLSMCNCSGGTELDKAVHEHLMRQSKEIWRWCNTHASDQRDGPRAAARSPLALLVVRVPSRRCPLPIDRSHLPWR